MQKATLIYNPLAGPANLTATIELVADFWRELGWQVAVEPTQAAGHAMKLATEAAAAGHRMVLAAGGDGTLGEVANGLAGTDAVMAPLPTGTANSFAKELLMPRPNQFNRNELLQAAESLAAGKVFRMDLGYFLGGEGKGRYWLLWAGTGADGYLMDRLEPRPKWVKKLGRVGYISYSLMMIMNLPAMVASVEVDGRTYEGEYLLTVVSNCRLYAGGELMLSPQASLDDGLFEIWLFRGRGVLSAVRYFFKVKSQRHLEDPDITMVKGRKITIHTTPPMPCQTDGDRAGLSPLRCEIRPGALHLLVPNTAPVGLFDQPGKTLI